jgi:hypothetical protein
MYNEYTEEIRSDCGFGQPYQDTATGAECFNFNSPEGDYRDVFYTVNICANGCVHFTSSDGEDEGWCTTDDTFVDESIQDCYSDEYYLSDGTQVNSTYCMSTGCST